MASENERQETLAEIEEELRSGEYAPLADRIHAAWEREKSQSWHHREMEELILRHEKEVAELKKLIPQPDPAWKAICEKCHDGDIEPDCEYYGEPNGCNSPIYGEHPKSQPIGNAAAMREALEYVLHFDATDETAMEDGLTDRERIAMYADHIEECQKKADAALSAPPRNCDIPFNVEGTTWNDADKAWRVFKRTHPDAYFDTPNLVRCIEWLLATAEKGDANEQK